MIYDPPNYNCCHYNCCHCNCGAIQRYENVNDWLAENIRLRQELEEAKQRISELEDGRGLKRKSREKRRRMKQRRGLK